MWWLYYVIGAVVIAAASAIYLLYRGYNRIRPKPLPGIPCPPLSHPVLGHHDLILHPLKHELRSQVCETAKVPLHQLVMMKFVSIFINDATLAMKVLKDLPNKGKIYNAFRYDTETPDIFASDGDDYNLRKSGLAAAFASLRVNEDHKAFTMLDELLAKHSVSGGPLDFKHIATSFALDIVLSIVFNFDINDNSKDVQKDDIIKALASMTDAQVSTGVYVLPDARKVSQEELLASKEVWKKFLLKILAHVKTSSPTSSTLPGSLMKMMEVSGGLYDEKAIIGDIHQILKHSLENISGTLCWLVYALHHHPKARAKLELAHQDDKTNFKSYLEAMIKETLRRYPVAGNMTVRSVGSAGYNILDNVTIPADTPIHIHMFSLQNTTREWEQPREFLPERWLESSNPTEPSPASESTKPKCPFAAFGKDIFSSGGFSEKSLAYLPFSSGERMCRGKDLSLDVIRIVLGNILVKYHLDPTEDMSTEDDLGLSVHSVIVPRLSKSTQVNVAVVTTPGKIPKKKSGWAQESDDE